MKIAALLTSLIPFSLFAAVNQAYINPASSNWNNAANWFDGSSNIIPNSQDATALIGIPQPPPLLATCTVTQDLAPTATIGNLDLFNTDPAFGYIIAGTLPITFSSSSGPATIDVSVGNTFPYTISTPLVLASNLEITQDDIDLTHPLTISGIISGAFSVTTKGAGIVVFSGINTFSTGLTVSAGTARCGLSNTLPTVGIVTMSGGTLELNNNPQTIGGLTGTAPVTLGTATLTINTAAVNSYAGSISGTGAVSVGGTGTQTFTSTNAYTGGTTVTGGTLQSGVNNALPVNRAVHLTGGTLNLNGFTQEVGNLSATTGSITLGTAGSGQLTISLSANQAFAGVISQSGQLPAGAVIFHGNGNTWSLNAAQTYTGLTTINSGTILLGVASGLPSGGAVTLAGTGVLNLNNFAQTVGTLTSAAGTQIILGTGALTVAPTASASFAGVISGAGTVTFQGPFAWTINTSQTYTGGTFITGGTLQMGTANGLASTGPVTVNSPGILLLSNNPLAIASLSGDGAVDLGTGALTLNTTTQTTFSGPIVGAGGSLVVQGSGTQILTGTNTYSGGTTVGGTATLQGNTNSLQGAIVNNSTLYFNQAFNATYGGPLTGTGLLQVGGGGILTLTGTPTQGTVSILNGELDIAAASTLTATTVTVNSGATLGGEGTIAANIQNSGTINPGGVTSQGTLTVIGDVTFLPGSTFIADLTPTTSDHLDVTGLVTIQPGSFIIIDAERGEYEEETRYAIITSTQPVVGQFEGFQQTNPFLEVDILYNQLLPGSVEVVLQIRPFSEVIQGGNAGAIAACISQAHLKADEDLEHLIREVIFLSVDEVRKILDQMQPSQLRALTVAEQTNALFAQQTLNWRMAEFDRSTCEKEASKCFPWNFWISLAGNWTDQRSADHNVGYSAPGVGFTVGFDRKISDTLFFGLAVEYGHVKLDWRESQGSSTINRMSTGPYLSYVGRFGYVNASLLASVAHFDTDRRIPFFDRVATSDHRGENFLTHLDGGLVFHPAPNVSLTPFAMLDLLFGWEDSYQETGAESLNFSISSSSSTMLRSELGLKISKCAIRSHGKWVHDLKASWVREERFNDSHLTATFRQFPCTFKVEGLYPSRNFLDLGMGLTFMFKQDRFAATLRYEGQFGEGASIQSGIAQLLCRF